MIEAMPNTSRHEVICHVDSNSGPVALVEHDGEVVVSQEATIIAPEVLDMVLHNEKLDAIRVALLGKVNNAIAVEAALSRLELSGIYLGDLDSDGVAKVAEQLRGEMMQWDNAGNDVRYR